MQELYYRLLICKTAYKIIQGVYREILSISGNTSKNAKKRHKKHEIRVKSPYSSLRPRGNRQKW